MTPKTTEKSYRPCVGIIVRNPQGKILIAMRKDKKDAWQMPQGGIEKDETAEAASFRELEEETGISPDKVSFRKITPDWLAYDYPADIDRKHSRNYRGQSQKWVLMDFYGQDEDINLDTKEPEFSAWRWAEPEEIISLIIPFKKDVYIKAFQELGLLTV